jgi:hypothetical protein
MQKTNREGGGKGELCKRAPYLRGHFISNGDSLTNFPADAVKCLFLTKAVHSYSFLTHRSKVSWGNRCLFPIHMKAPYGLTITLKKKVQFSKDNQHNKSY